MNWLRTIFAAPVPQEHLLFRYRFDSNKASKTVRWRRFRGLEFAPFFAAKPTCHPPTPPSKSFAKQAALFFESAPKPVAGQPFGRMALKKPPKISLFCLFFSALLPPLHCPLPRPHHAQSRRHCFEAASETVTDQRVGRMASKNRPEPAHKPASLPSLCRVHAAKARIRLAFFCYRFNSNKAPKTV